MDVECHDVARTQRIPWQHHRSYVTLSSILFNQVNIASSQISSLSRDMRNDTNQGPLPLIKRSNGRTISRDTLVLG